ncbi:MULTISPECIES: hypothetical protein [unclassified Myroides]|uniref:hypothetical protein n=1 Tax=unclassified Myroides TaxID=2642485 RepID=UPI0015F87EFA|nr:MULTISPECIES: hypothetical protein [unclassified Myroides]MBB1151141.1 hypothetical protein [Myroides sp. NP-2]MDM1408759.1 hypothetical protein [Myroides sp. DF42-4-2]
MKKILFPAIGCMFFAISCSNDAENKETVKDDLLKTELDYTSIKQSAEYLAFENRYMQYVKLEISQNDFLSTQTSLDLAKAFLIRIGEPNYGGYSSMEDIISYALAKYLEIHNS